jgi:hypothetical protein
MAGYGTDPSVLFTLIFPIKAFVPSQADLGFNSGISLLLYKRVHGWFHRSRSIRTKV